MGFYEQISLTPKELYENLLKNKCHHVPKKLESKPEEECFNFVGKIFSEEILVLQNTVYLGAKELSVYPKLRTLIRNK